MRLSWPWHRRRSTTTNEDPTDPLADLTTARAQRADAERKLRETRMTGREVSRVARTAQRIRSENQFSARWNEAFKGRPNHGG